MKYPTNLEPTMRKYIKLFQQKADNALEALTALRSKGPPGNA